MKKQRLYIWCLFILIDTSNSKAQEWESVGEINGSVVLKLFPDTVLDKLYIGGRFSSVAGIQTRNITSFDGHQFEKMTDSFTVNACWNLGCLGVSAIARYQGKIVAGTIRSATYEANPQIIGVGAWDGAQWYPLDGGLAMEYNDIVSQYLPAQMYDFCLSGDTLYAAGSILLVDSLAALGIGAWDGTNWHTFNVPEPISGEIFHAYCVSKFKGDIYVGGNILYYWNGETVRSLIRYDGESWQNVGQGLIGTYTHVRALEVFQNKLYVAGYFTQADGNPGNSIMSWDGEHWNDLEGGLCNENATIDNLFVHDDKLYVAGNFDCIGGIEAHDVAAWDGEKWCNIGSSIFTGSVHTIAVWRDTIYVGGGFYKINGAPISRLARFVGDLSNSVCSEPISTVGDAPNQVSAIHLSPNPVSNVLTINHSGQDRLLRYEIVDLLGRVYWSCANCADQQEILVASWPMGSYVVRGIGERGVVSKVFVKQ